MDIYSAFKLPPKVLVDTSLIPSMTKQSFKDECDINILMSRYERTGVLDFVNEHEAHYGDISPIEFHEAMNIVAQGKSMFEAMPGALRARFENEPAKFLEFVQDERNRDEAVSLGLVNPTPKAVPVDEPLVPSEPP